LTVCIAAICEAGGRNTKILLCADRLVSSVVQFVGGTPKIKQITDYCYAMHSSSDSLISDAILERVAKKARESGITSTESVVNILRQECIDHKREEIERDILFHYNVTADSLKVNQESMLQRAVSEVQNYQYHLNSEFIIAGLEPSGDAHIYWINQDGDYRCHDSIGYCAIGSGGLMAFLDLTKVVYNLQNGYSSAIPLIYFAKKTAERATGVGVDTDMLLIHYPKPEEKESKPALWNPFIDPRIKTLLDDTFRKIRESELNLLNQSCTQLFAIIKANLEAEKLKQSTVDQKIGS
jgi:20S proteasome alpha/beta subunit